MRYSGYILCILAALGIVSCSTTKYVPDGSYLLDKVEVRTDGVYNDIDLSRMNSYVRQKANSRWFSTCKLSLHIYSLSGRDSTKWINRVLRNLGDPPVIYDSLYAYRSVRDLTMELQNQGYLKAHVTADTVTSGKKLNITYTLHPGLPYYINTIKYDIRDSLVSQKELVNDTSQWKILPGNRFKVSQLDDERKRITSLLTNKGYYRFNKDYITYIADSLPDTRAIDLTLVMHPYRVNGTTDSVHTAYRIGNISYSNGNDPTVAIPIRRSVLVSNTMIESGKLYSSSALQNTYNHFGRLGAVRYTNISFTERPLEPVLDCNIDISTAKPHTITFQPEGTNTAGDLGAAVSLTYQNRNLFRGSELLNIKLRGAFEAITGLEGYANDNFEEYSAEASLTFPCLIAPFLSHAFRRRTNATSEVSVMYNLQNRPEYLRRVLSGAWRYKWYDPKHHDRYQIDLLEVNYVSMPWISDKFRKDYLEDSSNRNAILRYNYEDIFIMKFGGSFTYNNGVYALRASAETAGNLLSLASNVLSTKGDSDGQKHFMGVAYAQYAKADVSFTRTFPVGYSSSVVLHGDFGIAYPYGNSRVLPFEKRYFSGGANGVRGWSVRNLGPGRYTPGGDGIDFINQTGDIRLVLNMEYRAHVFWKLDGALFVDAGNIWTLLSYDEQPGGQFSFGTFWKEIAVAYGLGIRLNVDYLILRFDFGMKAVDPARTGRRQFPITSPKLSRDLAFHFAVGMPF